MPNEKPTAPPTAKPCRCLICAGETRLAGSPAPGVYYYEHIHAACLATMMAAARLNVRLIRLRGVQGYNPTQGRN